MFAQLGMKKAKNKRKRKAGKKKALKKVDKIKKVVKRACLQCGKKKQIPTGNLKCLECRDHKSPEAYHKTKKQIQRWDFWEKLVK